VQKLLKCHFNGTNILVIYGIISQHYVHGIYQNHRTLMSTCTLRSHLASRAGAGYTTLRSNWDAGRVAPSLCKHPYYSRHTNTFSPYFAHTVQAEGGGRPSGKGISMRGGGRENLRDSVTRFFSKISFFYPLLLHLFHFNGVLEA
jgi:hypothetical protein